MHPSPAAITRVQELARDALAAEAGGRPRGVVRADVGPEDLFAAAARHRVTDLLHARADALGLATDYGTALVDALAAAHAAARRRVAVQLLEIGTLLELFAAAGLPVLVVKGPALAVQTAQDVAARGHGDIDLLVAPESVEQAHALLVAHGWQPRRWGSAVPGTWAWRHLLTSFNEVAFDGPASTVDLHWRLDPNPDVLPDFSEAWARRVVVGTGVVDVPTLDPATAFLHTCQHAAKDDWRWLRSVVDVHRLTRLDEVRRLLAAGPSQGRSSGHVPATLAVTDRLVGLPDPPAAGPPTALVLAGHGSRRQVQRAVRAQGTPVRADRPFPMAQSLRDLRYRLAVSRTPRAVIGALSATALPAPSLEGIDDRTAWTALPKLLLRRITWLGSRSLRWLVSVR